VGQQDLDGFGAPAAFEGQRCPGERGLDRGGGHEGSIASEASLRLPRAATAADYNPERWV